MQASQHNDHVGEELGEKMGRLIHLLSITELAAPCEAEHTLSCWNYEEISLAI
jgi:hypothetical protein